MNAAQITFAMDAALSLLPAKMDTPDARIQLFAIGLQESRFEHRRQIGGPARGFLQFERGTKETRGGIYGVLLHQGTYDHIRRVLAALQYRIDADMDELADISYEAVEHNDVLVMAYGRLLLWTVAGPIPHNDPEGAWAYYLSGWRPGKPHKGTWAQCYQKAQQICV